MSMKSRIVCCFAAGIFLVTTIRAQTAEGTQAASTTEERTAARGPRNDAQDGQERPELHRRNPRYQQCKNDVLQLNFTMTPDLNQKVTDQPDGYSTLQEVGDIHVE